MSNYSASLIRRLNSYLQQVLSEMLHHSQELVGAGSPIALNGANRLNKPAPTRGKAPDRHWCNISVCNRFYPTASF